MAYVGIVASPSGLRLARTGADPARRLSQMIARLPRGAPITILIHGYRYDPARRGSDPHRQIYAFRDEQTCRKIRSWPLGLGFTRHNDAGGGLCIGFGWPAHLPHLSTLLKHGRTGFAQVYETAPDYGAQLAGFIDLIHGLAPSHQVDILAHSLGARVALSSLPGVSRAPGRIVLLGAAEYRSAARSFLQEIRTTERPEIYNVTARFNDLYDAMFETFAPRRDWSDRALGVGIGEPLPNWLDIQLDRADVATWINERGVPLRMTHTRFCHWSFYTRGGAFGVYRAILRRKPGWDIASLRLAPCFAGQEPRWSRIRPGTPGLLDPAQHDCPSDLKSA